MYRNADKGWLKHWDFIVLDAVCLQIAYIAAYWLRHGIGLSYKNSLYCNMAFVFMLMQIFVTFFSESFKNVLKRGYCRELFCTLEHTCLIILMAVFYLFATQRGEDYSRIMLVAVEIFYAAFTYAVRILWKKYLKGRGVGSKGRRSLLILTGKSAADVAAANIQYNNYEKFQVAGIVLLDGKESEVGQAYRDIPVVACGAASAAEFVCRRWVDEVFVNLSDDINIPQTLLDDLIEMGVTLHLKLTAAVELKGQKSHAGRVGAYTVLTSSVNTASWKQAAVKRTMDLAGGIVGCLITVLLFLFVAPCICIKSPGPVFFSQIRVGKNGKRFKIYKFRSMYMDAEQRKTELMKQNRVSDGMMFKLDHDPRIIGGEKGIGGIIRKYSIDEFPQFWNVLKGDMSLVGTRPPTLDEWEKYDFHHRVRLAAKPGITGMWQVSGRSKITDFEEVVKLDKSYILNWSPGLDMRILLKTVGVVVLRRGAM